jgi:mannosyltransferase
MRGWAAPGLSAPASQRSLSAADTAPGRTVSRAERWPLVLSWLTVLGPVVAELLVGGYQIGRASLWRDEGYTREVAQRSPAQILALLRHQDAVHGLYYLIMHLVIGGLGSTPAAMRLPSLVAASLAAGLTAALGRRLAIAARAPAASATGLLAGLLFVALPATTWYAQDARPYAMATLCAVGASYLLVRGMTEPSRWWWAAYAAVIVVLALLNLVALILLAAHAASLLIMRARIPVTEQARAQLRAATRRWLVAAAVAVAALSPLLYFSSRQSGQLGWVTKPSHKTMAGLLADFSGSRYLIPLAIALILAGLAADVSRRQRVVCVPAAVTLPWLVLPPLVLLAVSELKPVYVERYVVFCMPAVALLMAGGLAWLARLAALTPAGRRYPPLALLPSALLVAVIAATVVAPQQAARRTSSRSDNLVRVASIVARYERPGDAVLYLPWDTRVVGLTYPGPFARLANVSQLKSPIAAASLTGKPVPATLVARRIAGTRRVWTVRWQHGSALRTPLSLAEARLVARMHLIRRWTVKSVVLRLYAATGTNQQ